MVEYAIYKGDKFQFIETLEGCAERLGVKTDFIKWLATPTAIKRLDQGDGNRLIAVKLKGDWR